MLDTCQLQQSSDQPIVIDDSQSDTSTITTTAAAAGGKQKDPWVPISDETDEAIENALSTASQESIVFPPAIARRMPTELMASRLPKIQLKQGRYRYGKPIPEKRTADSTTTTTTNESCSNDISQSASTSLANTSISFDFMRRKRFFVEPTVQFVDYHHRNRLLIVHSTFHFHLNVQYNDDDSDVYTF